jgi:hypothetical protein
VFWLHAEDCLKPYCLRAVYSFNRDEDEIFTSEDCRDH